MSNVIQFRNVPQGWFQVTGDFTNLVAERESIRAAFFRAEDSGNVVVAQRMLDHLNLQSELVRLYESGERVLLINYEEKKVKAG